MEVWYITQISKELLGYDIEEIRFTYRPCNFCQVTTFSSSLWAFTNSSNGFIAASLTLAVLANFWMTFVTLRKKERTYLLEYIQVVGIIPQCNFFLTLSQVDWGLFDKLNSVTRNSVTGFGKLMPYCTMWSGDCWIDVAQKEETTNHWVDMLVTGIRKFLLDYNVNTQIQLIIKYHLNKSSNCFTEPANAKRYITNGALQLSQYWQHYLLDYWNT